MFMKQLQIRTAVPIIDLMKIGNAAVSLALFAAIVILASCSGQPANSNSQTSPAADRAADNSSAAKTNVEELGMLINVPYESDEVFWKEDVKGKKLVAILRFAPAEANRLIADAEKIRPAQNVTIATESWFPPELVAQSDTTGDDTLNGKAYAANAFLQDPYNDGRITRIQDTDYFILEVTAK
jgi:hypothetical protein